jgi:hypothetical protein
MAQPISAALSAGASFTPVAGHGHDLAFILPGLDDPDFYPAGETLA